MDARKSTLKDQLKRDFVTHFTFKRNKEGKAMGMTRKK